MTSLTRYGIIPNDNTDETTNYKKTTTQLQLTSCPALDGGKYWNPGIGNCTDGALNSSQLIQDFEAQCVGRDLCTLNLS